MIIKRLASYLTISKSGKVAVKTGIKTTEKLLGQFKAIQTEWLKMLQVRRKINQ